MDFRLPRGMGHYCTPRSIIFTQSWRFHRCEREPDKRSIIIYHEENLIEQLKVSASFLMYDDDPNTTCIVALTEQFGSDTSGYLIIALCDEIPQER